METIDFNFDNVGGITHIYAFPPEAVHAITRNPLTGFSRLSLLAEARIIEIPVYDAQETSFAEQQTLEDAGNSYAPNIAGFMPKQQHPLLAPELERGEWLVVHQDGNGNILLSGTEEVPLTFTSNKSIGADGAAKNGYFFTFTASTPTPSTQIDPRAFFI